MAITDRNVRRLRELGHAHGVFIVAGFTGVPQTVRFGTLDAPLTHPRHQTTPEGGSQERMPTAPPPMIVPHIDCMRIAESSESFLSHQSRKLLNEEAVMQQTAGTGAERGMELCSSRVRNRFSRQSRITRAPASDLYSRRAERMCANSGVQSKRQRSSGPRIIIGSIIRMNWELSRESLDL